jgi:hypothetical protein
MMAFECRFLLDPSEPADHLSRKLTNFSCHAECVVRSALDKIPRQAAQARHLVLRLHVGAGLAHRRDDAVQRNPMLAFAVQRERGRRDRLDRADGVALADPDR